MDTINKQEVEGKFTKLNTTYVKGISIHPIVMKRGRVQYCPGKDYSNMLSSMHNAKLVLIVHKTKCKLCKCYMTPMFGY